MSNGTTETPVVPAKVLDTPYPVGSAQLLERQLLIYPSSSIATRTFFFQSPEVTTKQPTVISSESSDMLGHPTMPSGLV
jgi:hypothetical protein